MQIFSDIYERSKGHSVKALHQWSVITFTFSDSSFAAIDKKERIRAATKDNNAFSSENVSVKNGV